MPAWARRINTIMQTCFFAISGVLPRDEAIARSRSHREDLRQARAARGRPEELRRRRRRRWPPARVELPARRHRDEERRRSSPRRAGLRPRSPRPMLPAKGDLLPVSLPGRRHLAHGTAQWEKRNIALEIPVWDESICIQCNKCVDGLPARRHPRQGVTSRRPCSPARRQPSSRCRLQGKDFKGMKYTIQVAPEDCTGCTLCVRSARRRTSPTRARPSTWRRRRRFASRSGELGLLPQPARGGPAAKLKSTPRGASSAALFEFSGACAGCGETPYVKLLTQLFGDRALIANATGCSSIYGGNLPTTPYTANATGAARPGQLAVRGQRRVRLRHAPGRQQLAALDTPAR
jgi:pyruvate-ferredoxin/flavodoxin oxidoreductase